jgi:hypothetical protein
MSHALRSRGSADRDADQVGASLGRKALNFVVWPFGIVLAMRAQRTREAARLVNEFSAAIDFRRRK